MWRLNHPGNGQNSSPAADQSAQYRGDVCVGHANGRMRPVRSGIVGVFRELSGVRRLAFTMFASVALILVFASLALLIAGPADRWPLAVIGMLCAAVLEISWLRVGSVPHRSPVISVPTLALPALAPVLPLETAIGLVVLGVLLGILWESRRVSVALYSAGLVGAASVASAGIFLALRQAGAPDPLPVAVATVAYVGFVIGVELLRRRFTRPPVDLAGRPALSGLRVVVVALCCAALAVVSAFWSAEGLPFLV